MKFSSLFVKVYNQYVRDKIESILDYRSYQNIFKKRFGTGGHSDSSRTQHVSFHHLPPRFGSPGWNTIEIVIS